MIKIRLRTKFLLSLILTTTALTTVSLLAVQHYLERHARREMYEQLHNSITTFQQFAQQRQRMLAQSAGFTANLPNIKALMTTRHEQTVQDGSLDFWQLAENDLFVLADPSGKVMALHTASSTFDRADALQSLQQTLQMGRSRDWWYGGGRLYEVFLQPIYFGSAQDDVPLGLLATGFEIDSRLSQVIASIASSDVVFRYGDAVVNSTLLPNQQEEFSRLNPSPASGSPLRTEELRLGGETFVGTSVELAPSGSRPVTLTVLKSFDAATLFLQNLNHLLLGIGLIGGIAGSALIFLISHTFTRPLAGLVSGVRALEKGDFSYPLQLQGRDELGELTAAFDRMRRSLKNSQDNLVHAERLATIGRMASSISHDLRHPLTTILAYSEMLSESGLDEAERASSYEEIRASVHSMTGLIGSLLEFSKAQQAMHLVFGDVGSSLEHTIGSVRLRPEFKQVRITLRREGSTEGWFDFAKLERAFHNLLQNACEAVPREAGTVEVTAHGAGRRLEISIKDNGPGIPDSVRGDLFQPFVTAGKSGGTGLGLAVVRKIVSDHGGEIRVEATGSRGTTFKLTLPTTPPSLPALPAAAGRA